MFSSAFDPSQISLPKKANKKDDNDEDLPDPEQIQISIPDEDVDYSEMNERSQVSLGGISNDEQDLPDPATITGEYFTDGQESREEEGGTERPAWNRMSGS